MSTPLLSVTRGVTSRVIKLRAKHVDDESRLSEIELRGAKIENFNDFLNKLALAPFYGYVVHEKIYDKDFTIKKLEYIPHECMKWDKDKQQLFLKGENKEIEITEQKFIISVHDKTLNKPLGKSLFEYGLEVVFEDLKSVNEKVRGLQEAYGDVIPVIGFYQEELDGKTEDQKNEYLKQRAQKYKVMLDNDKIFSAPLQPGIPLKDQVHFISLTDLSLEMHKVLMEKYETKIEKFIKGSVYSESTAGSQAKDRIQQDEKEKIEDHIAKFISSELQKLIKDDAMFYGYSPECYYFTFELDAGEGELEKVEQEKVKTKREKIGLFQDLKNLGYKVSAEKIAEAIGIDKKDLKEDVSLYPLGPEFSKSSKIDFKLGRLIELSNLYDNYLETAKNDIIAKISTQIDEQFKSINQGDEEFRFNLDLQEFEDQLILSRLQGYANSKVITFGTEIESFNPFEMKFEEAINAFLNKTPILYETIEQITDEIRANSFWLKKSLDLEVTERVFKTLKKSLENGGTFKEWIEDSAEILSKAGLLNNPYYLETVYRTNMLSQYSIGNYVQQMEVTKQFPYWQYVSIIDNSTSDICNKLHKKIYKWDDIFWSVYYPPNHFRCRSLVISLSKDEIGEQTISKEAIEIDVGNFKGNPGQKYWKTLKKLTTDKEKNLKLWE